MMIGNENRYAQRICLGNAVDRRDTVVDRDQQRRRALGGDTHDRRRQAVAVIESIGNQEFDVTETESSETAQHQRRTGGPIDVKVADDNYLLVALFEDQPGRLVDMLQRRDRRQPLQRVINLFGRRHPAHCIETRVQRVNITQPG